MSKLGHYILALSQLGRYIAPLSERQRTTLRTFKYYVIPLNVTWYKSNPNIKGYGLTKERSIKNLLKKRARK